MKSIVLFLFASVSMFANAQNVGIGTAAPNSSAVLDVSSTNKGMLIPRLSTAARNAIANPAMGLLVFDTDKYTLMFYDGAAWRAMAFTDESKSAIQNRNASQPSASANFGSAVAISGDYAIIGASRYSGSGLGNMGLAYIFSRTNSGWKQLTRLAAKDSAAGDYFGGAVAISGDYAIVGSCTKKINANVGQGKAYIYHRIVNNWVLDTALVSPAGQASDNFGWAVGVCAYNTGGVGVAIGIPYSDGAGPDRGEVRFWRKNTSNWQYVGNASPFGGANSDHFGTSIAMDTDYVAIGANGHDNAALSLNNAGAVYIYNYGGVIWSPQQEIEGTIEDAEFGFSISISSTRMAIGAPWATFSPYTSSSVYLYERTGNTWSNISNMYIHSNEVLPYADEIRTASGTPISIRNLTFGISVSLTGNTLLVGSSGGSYPPNGGIRQFEASKGTVYLYKNWEANTYSRTNVVQSEFPDISDFFGTSVAISGNSYIIGSPNATVNGFSNVGNVYFGNN